MNGNTNMAIGETTTTITTPPTTVTNEQNSMPEPKKEMFDTLANGSSCASSNDTKTERLKNEDPIDPKSKINDALQCSLRNETNNKNDFLKVAPDVILNDSVDTQKDYNNSESIEDQCSQKVVASNKKQIAEDKDLISDKDTDCRDPLKDSQNVETNNSDEVSHLPKIKSNINGEQSKLNSDDDPTENGKDTAGDIVSVEETVTQIKEEEKSENGDLKREAFKFVDNKHHSDDEIDTGSEEEINAKDSVSINSGSGVLVTSEDLHDGKEISKNNENEMKKSDLIDTHNASSKTSNILEISCDNNDCIITAENKITKTTDSAAVAFKRKRGSRNTATNLELRRSNRTIKRKKYDDEVQSIDNESDVEEVGIEDPLKIKTKHIDNTKTGLAGKQVKAKVNQKNVTTIILDPETKIRTYPAHKPLLGSGCSSISQNIYERIISRGTSVTPVVTKNMATQACLLPPAPILPTLTDEMFVVEAPSFIVPYVYEKPPLVPFKEFVDKWGKEIEEEKVKEEQELLEKIKEQKAKREQERQEKRERGEEVIESEDELQCEEIKKKKAEKAERKERRRRKKEDDDVSWDGSSTEESEDDIISDEDQKTIIKDTADLIGDVQPDKISKADQATKSESYFDLCLGKFFMNIGLSLVQEYVQTDLLNQQNRKLQREKKGGHDTKNRRVSIALLTKNLENSKKINRSLTFEQKKCEFCTFKTESALAMSNHLETPHMKNNVYSCNYCPFEIRSPHDILYHMEKEHNVKGKLERTPAQHQCANCPFEDHSKGKLGRHLMGCTKKFKLETNLAPPAEWEHPAKIAKLARGRGNSGPYQVAHFGRNHVDSVSNVRIPISNAGPSQAYRGRAPAATPRPTGILIRSGPPSQFASPNTNAKKSTQVSITVTPPGRPGLHPIHAANAKGFVMCEICDGYIKDLEQLRNHMQWIHKVKIHPKMIYNRPPLNCQKCHVRFFTDQGLERHLLGSHGLVTSAIQEAANRGKDAGRCPVCGKVYQWKLLSHVSRDHNLVLKPAHLSYKCTVCTATFGMYRQFENHVYSAHSVVAKKVIDKKSSAATAKANANDNAAKQLKINDEITITPQPMKMPGSSKEK